jgi:non-canonical purine NTP pyrophosphatase (RdgB/HAM1 family)
MTKINIVFITGNEGKRREVSEILGTNFNVINIKLDLPEIQSISVQDVIKEKIKYALKMAKTKKIFTEIKDKFFTSGVTINTIKDVNIICEDSGFYIKQMNNFPGALIKWYYEAIGNEGIIKQNNNSIAETKCVIGLVLNGKIKKSIIGSRKGKIATEMKGGDGFGWDPSFIPNLKGTEYEIHNGKSYAELPSDIKNLVSHRSDAFNKLKNKFNN